MKSIKGSVLKFGNGIDTDIIIPARYLNLPLEEMKFYAMAPIDPSFCRKVTPDSIIVAGSNFGCGSSREQAPKVLKELGIQAVVAKSFARIFFRNAINLGLMVVECSELVDQVQTGDRIKIDPLSAQIDLSGHNKHFLGSKLPDFLIEIVKANGLIPYLASRKC